MANAKPTLGGTENELGWFFATEEERGRLPLLINAVMELLRASAPSVLCAEKVSNQPGLMLANGAKIYADAGGFLEGCSPELRDPMAAPAYQRANELLLLRVLPQAARRAGIDPAKVSLLRASTDYQGSFYGYHVNVHLWDHTAVELAPLVIPFFVTSFFARAGGWNTGYCMSQKARAIRKEVSPDTRVERGIVNVRDEHLAAPPHKRGHFTAQDSVMTDHGNVLTLGTAMLVMRMLDEGASVGPAVRLADPIGSLHKLDEDPTWKTPLDLACGLRVSAIEVHEHYLRAAERFASVIREPWAAQIVALWRDAVDRLKKGPEELSRLLDPYIKMRFYGQALADEGLTFEDFAGWCAVLSLLREHLPEGRLRAKGLREQLRERAPRVAFDFAEDRMRSNRLSWSMLPKAHDLWKRMMALDLRYHDIAPSGVFWRLKAAGLVASRLVEDSDVVRAMSTPPADTRARARGNAIQLVAQDPGALANWDAVVTPTRSMKLDDPFQASVAWTTADNNKK